LESEICFPVIPGIDSAAKDITTNLARSVTSVKTMDLTKKSYQSARAVYNRLMNYAEKLSNFRGATYAKETVIVDQNTVRNLSIGIPGRGTAAQQLGIEHAIEDARSLGVYLNTFTMP
jgi:hypothetical protein